MAVVESPLGAWEAFYVIIGTSAAALTGLQFVVIALIADSSRRPGGSPEIQAFGTPTVVHFGAVLLISAVVSAPWHSLANAGIALGAIGGAGVAYTGVVIRRARRQKGYKPVLEDWIWHCGTPLISYAMVAAAAILQSRDPHTALFLVGAASVLLVFTGIHNAWDTVTYIAIDFRGSEDQPEPRAVQAPAGVGAGSPAEQPTVVP